MKFFQKGGDERTHHVHVFEAHSPHIERHLAFRDYLRTHPDVRREYGALKRKLAREFSDDIEAYVSGKAPFVKRIERQALEWYRNQLERCEYLHGK